MLHFLPGRDKLQNHQKERFKIDPSSYFHSRKPRCSDLGDSRFVGGISGRSRRDLCLGTVTGAGLLESFAPAISELQLMVKESTPVAMTQHSCAVWRPYFVSEMFSSGVFVSETGQSRKV